MWLCGGVPALEPFFSFLSSGLACCDASYFSRSGGQPGSVICFPSFPSVCSTDPVSKSHGTCVTRFFFVCGQLRSVVPCLFVHALGDEFLNATVAWATFRGGV
ncbi:uncharacterized protein B0H64DRAFT_397266 [Chaetomium fimeti]|uniref:Secreted protein n=1 Tax=Chaetomium fimeti TaxID=1854472 RepID=A0AAE0HGK1_9PEZI|nr:hypothetical protein B0H64DRAFT_397266 [Chaetomium fimeti]